MAIIELVDGAAVGVDTVDDAPEEAAAAPEAKKATKKKTTKKKTTKKKTAKTAAKKED